MTRRQDGRPLPPRVDEFDEEDDTVVELGGTGTGDAVGSLTKPVPAHELAGIDEDSDEDEATELLPRFKGNKVESSGPVSASKSAVRIEGPQAEVSAEVSAEASAEVSADGDYDEDEEEYEDDETLALPDLAAARAAAAAAPASTTARDAGELLAEEATADQTEEPEAFSEPTAGMSEEEADQRHPPIRPLSAVEVPDYEDPTLSHRSSPRLVRMTFKRGEHSAPRAPAAGGSVGTLLIDAPEDAVVHVDGQEHPPGPVKLENVSRFAKFKVRVIAAGHSPWSATLSLNGKRAARIRPTLVKGPG